MASLEKYIHKESRLCYKCHNNNEPYDNKKTHEKLVWGLVCCTNTKCKPRIKPYKRINEYGSNVYNRDTNAVLNMLYIVRELIKNGERPKIFCRDVNIQ